MNKITAILIDDEKKALESLALKVNRFFPKIDIIKTCNNPKEAINLINTLEPNLVFLDIEMPVLSGFDVLSQVNIADFETIFVTAYNNYAIEAIKHSAIGYIVKPIDNEELILAVNNALKNITKKNAFEKNKNLLEHLGVNTKKTNLAIPTKNGLTFIKTENIIRFEGTDGYTKIISSNKKESLSSYNIGKFMKILEKEFFFSPHKSHFINLHFVETILKEGTILLKDGSIIPLSKTRRAELIYKMQQL